ncbi:MAG: hypothetical protein BMS9Abin36_0337 [Gammaproteobacteria bacterium]|nr:MAG: hypothetical protein BMS9Abin36_0337 [Gammaproteobacteria bacterium]
MKLVFTILALLFLVVGVTLMAMRDPGYVVISRLPWSLEMPLTLFIALFILLVIAAYLLINLGLRTWRIPAQVSAWRRSKNSQQSNADLQTGLLALIEQDWKTVEDKLQTQTGNNLFPIINHLISAYAKQQQGDTLARDKYLQLAREQDPEQELFIDITQACWQRDAGQFAQSQAGLETLQEKHPKEPRVLGELARTYDATANWSALAALIPQLKKHKAMDNETLALTEAMALAGEGHHDQAEKVLRKALDHDWSETLVSHYGNIEFDATKQLKQLEHWKQKHGSSDALTLALAQASRRAGFLDQALGLIKSIPRHEEHKNAMLEKARVLEQQGKVSAAITVFRDVVS